MQEGTTVGQFTLVRVLGSTPHSDVWKAADRDGDHAAVKVLRTEETEPYQRFRDEVSFHRAGPYKGVLPVIDAEVPDNPSEGEPAWFAMPIEGWIERNINGSWVLAPYATP